ncbi:hypothetical protein C8Q75DRAFT_780745 [Abortiporus biennis]|nr:hypothetical protein C8Q75DRAFT_780745 [Abortiporus biennis]
MKAFTSLFSAALLVASALGQQLTINTPASVVVCQPILLTFSGGTREHSPCGHICCVI